MRTEFQSPADEVFEALRGIEKDENLTEKQSQLIGRAAHMINALDVLTSQCVSACKRMGYVYNPEDKQYGEFSQAFFWLQEKGREAHSAATAGSKYALLVGVEQRIEELFKFYQENKNAG